MLRLKIIWYNYITRHWQNWQAKRAWHSAHPNAPTYCPHAGPIMIRDAAAPPLAIDHGRDGDEFAEVKYRLLPDGTREILSMRTWKSAPVLIASQNNAESDPSATPDRAGAGTHSTVSPAEPLMRDLQAAASAALCGESEVNDKIGALAMADRLTRMARWQRENMDKNDRHNNFKNGSLVEEAAACLRRAAALLDSTTHPEIKP